MLVTRLGIMRPYAAVGHASTFIKLQDRNVVPKGITANPGTATESHVRSPVFPEAAVRKCNAWLNLG